MIPYERQELIVKHLTETGLLKIDDLQRLLPSVSISTLRRDLKELEKLGKIEYLTGGAIKLHDTSGELSIVAKNTLNSAEKAAIARRAENEVADGDIIYLDSGSTCTALLQHLLARPVTVYTTNADACAITEHVTASIVVIGGTLNPLTSSLCGPITEHTLRELFFDKAFLGVNAVDDERGAMTPGYEEAAKKRLVRANSQTTYLLCDSSKFHQFSNVKVFDLAGVTLIADKPDEKLGKHVRILTPEA